MKMFDFKANNTILFRKTPLKAQNDYIFQKFASSLAMPMPNCTTISINALFNKSVNHNHI